MTTPDCVARVVHEDAVHLARPHPRGLVLADGRILAEDEVTWLPPVQPGTVIALGLNYAAHAQELAAELARPADAEPLVFFKTAGSLAGHRARTQRPRGVRFMHYECELAVVIGRPAWQVSAAAAMAHVAGYTVANDYAVRDHLVNWLRPNLRAKNRDGATLLGPWLVPASRVADPHALALRTFVNGALTQQGSTSNMLHRIPALIEFLSGFMPLAPGDVILTGTPEGVCDVRDGDEVSCEIEGIGRLLGVVVDEPPPAS